MSSAPALTVRGKRVVLRPIDPADYDLLLAWQNDPEIAHWMDYRTPFTLEEIERDVQRAQREGVPFVIELDGRPVGKCGLNQFRAGASACSIYVYVGDRAVWNEGVGRDAVMTLLAHAFDEHAVTRVELTVLADNVRARRVYDACGFTQDAVLRARSQRGDGWHETTAMSVTRASFDAIRTGYGL